MGALLVTVGRHVPNTKKTGAQGPLIIVAAAGTFGTGTLIPETRKPEPQP